MTTPNRGWLMRCVVSRCSVVAVVMSVALAVASSAAQTIGPEGLPVITGAISLADALRFADRNNVQITQSLADSGVAIASAAKAKAALQPRLSATTYESTGSESSIITSSTGVNPQNLIDLSPRPFADQNVTIMFPLTTGGGLQNRATAARDDSGASRSDTDAVRLTAQQSVTRAYANVLLDQASLSSAESTLAAEQEQVRITQEKVNMGAQAPVDLLREQAAMADAQSGVTQSQTNVYVDEVDLKSAMGVSQMSEITLSDTLDTLRLASAPTFPTTLASAIQHAETDRPEFRAAQDRVASARALASASRSEYAPQIYAVGMADTTANERVRGVSGYSVGLTASITLYDGGDRSADVAGADAVLARANADDRAVETQIEREVSDAWYTYAAVDDRITSAQAALSAAKQGYALADLRYNAGKSTTADRLDALAALSKAQAMLAQSEADQIDDREDLAATLGTGLAR